MWLGGRKGTPAHATCRHHRQLGTTTTQRMCLSLTNNASKRRWIRNTRVCEESGGGVPKKTKTPPATQKNRKPSALPRSLFCGSPTFSVKLSRMAACARSTQCSAIGSSMALWFTTAPFSLNLFFSLLMATAWSNEKQRTVFGFWLPFGLWPGRALALSRHILIKSAWSARSRTAGKYWRW